MMEFHSDRPIYRQIASYAEERILSGDWRPGEKVPSVRELSAAMVVNSHTVLKAYEYLQDLDILEPRRGMGYYLSADAPERVLEARRREFFNVTVPEFMAEMRRLGLGASVVFEKIETLEQAQRRGHQ